MTYRPTPEQLAAEERFPADLERLAFLARLTSNGYVIVHPDDVPEHSHGVTPPNQVHSFNWVEGWNACRRHIVEQQETP